jgi:hypothetical protein
LDKKETIQKSTITSDIPKMSLEIIYNEHKDSFDSRAPEANSLIRVLRKRCLDADPNISKHIDFEVNAGYGANKIIMRGTSLYEVFIAAVHDYLEKCDYNKLQVIEFKIPKYCIECVIFQFTKSDSVTCDEAYFDSVLPHVDVLRECLKECYMRYHKVMSKQSHRVAPKQAMPTILVCTRKGLCENTEDKIHEFLGNRAINRWNSVTARSKELISSEVDKCSIDDLHRGWNSVNRMVWDLSA